MTKAQISAAQIMVTIMVTTPEKRDVITCRSTDMSYTNLVRLLIINEINLLHDEHGPVFEAVIACAICRIEQTRTHIRLVGISATLLDYQGVAAFLHVDPNRGLFYFDASYRPCPAAAIYRCDGKKGNQALPGRERGVPREGARPSRENQTFVFVHSCKETAKTVRFLRDMAIENETIS